MNLPSKTYLWTAGGVVLAAVALGVTLVQKGGAGQNQSGSHNMQAGHDIIVSPEDFAKLVRDLTREQAEQKALQYAEVPPPAGQAAPYVVIDTPHHLWVLSSATGSGHHIGAAFNNGTLWADCRVTSDFDPDRTDRTGPDWLRIRWPNTEPTDQMFSSQLSDRATGFVYAGQVLPAGHSGQIPVCPTAR